MCFEEVQISKSQFPRIPIIPKYGPDWIMLHKLLKFYCEAIEKKNRFRFSKLWISLNLRDLLSSWVLKIVCLVLKIGSNDTSELSWMYLNVYVKKAHNQYSWKFRAVVFRSKIKKLYCLLWMGFNCLKAKAISRRQFNFFHQVPTKFLKIFTTKFLVLILSTSEGWMTESTLEPPSGFKHGVRGLGIQHLNSFMTEAVII